MSAIHLSYSSDPNAAGVSVFGRLTPAFLALFLSSFTTKSSGSDGSPLHTIIAQVDLAGPALDDWQRGVLQARGRVPHTPGTEIAAYLARYTADQASCLVSSLLERASAARLAPVPSRERSGSAASPLFAPRIRSKRGA